MRVDSIGQVFFALVMVGLGVLGLVSGDFASVWQPVPKEIPGERFWLTRVPPSVSLAAWVCCGKARRPRARSS